MESSKLAFVGARLKLARAFRGCTAAELGDQIGVTHSYIVMFEAERRIPPPSMLEVLGAALGVRPSFFMRPVRNEFRDGECFFRRRRTTAAAVRTRVLAHGTLFGELVDYLDSEIELPPTNVPQIRVATPAEMERAAERCRMHWGLGLDTPITNMVRVLEHAGVVATRFEGEAEKIDAFSRPGARNIVVLNSDKGSASRSRFDAAHELGHLVLHSGVEHAEELVEQEADAFASAFLLPRAGFVREFPRSHRLDWPAMFALKARWHTSVSAIVRRARDLGLIDAAQYQRAYKYMSAQGWTRGEPEEFEPELPELVGVALNALADDGVTSRDVAAHLGLDLATFARVAGVELPEPPVEQEVVRNVYSLFEKTRERA